MWSILHMTVTSLVAVVAPRAGKIIKNDISILKEFLVFLYLSKKNQFHTFL